MSGEYKPLSIAYDPERDTLTVNGVGYSGELFRGLAGFAPGTIIEIIRRDADGVVTVADRRDLRPHARNNPEQDVS